MKQKLNEYPYKKLQHSNSFSNKLELNEGMEIVAYEKLDGANASFQKDGDTLSVYSRKMELDTENTLNGFYDFVQTQLDKSKIPVGLRIFGEWMTPHTVKYIDDVQKKFFLFDALNMETQEYITYDEVQALAEQIGLEMAPIFYRGPYQGPSHLNSFKGKSHFADNGEGLVVLLVEQNAKLKMVAKEFEETKSPTRPSKPIDKMNEKELLEHYGKVYSNEFLTEARISKMIHKKLDEGLLTREVPGKQIGKIFSEIVTDIIEDAYEEEKEYIEENYKTLLSDQNWKQAVKSKSMGKVISIAKQHIAIT